MAKYIVAVSGGVDSVVLLDMIARKQLLSDASELVVAHFDHGIRQESADDAVFVRELAAGYGASFEMKREELGKDASEEKARDRRYAFLRSAAKKHEAIIVTAHHADDLVETIAINLTRGTGWRGLAVLDSPDIVRPLLDRTKADLMAYAKDNNLVWREDATNRDLKYLRNELRRKLDKLPEESKELLKLYRDRQVFLRREADTEASRLVGASPYQRHMFIAAPDVAALELLRAVFVKEIGVAPTRPQLARALHAVKVLHDKKRHEAMSGATLCFTKTRFIVETDPEVV